MTVGCKYVDEGREEKAGGLLLRRDAQKACV